MNIVFFDYECRDRLYPLTEIRPACELRIGILTIREKWEAAFPEASFSFLTEAYLSVRYPFVDEGVNIFLVANVCPDDQLMEQLTAMNEGVALFHNNKLMAYCGTYDNFTQQRFDIKKNVEGEPQVIDQVYHIFQKNFEAITMDYYALTEGRTSLPLSPSNKLIGPETDNNGCPLLFIEEGAVVEGTILNTNNGPIYIGRNAEIMEGSMIRGPFAADEGCVVNMGTKIYGGTTLGPYCKVGGELNNVVLMAYTNKAHDGFLGNAVLGQWCNIGAGVNASNLKNDYTEVKLWNNEARRFQKTGLQFCGLVMGDYSRLGVNLMLNTATMVGVGCNIFGAGFPRNLVTSFIDGGASGFDLTHFKNFIATMEVMMARRNKTFTEEEKEVCRHLYDLLQ